MRTRLGGSIPNVPKKCNCKKGPTLDKLGTHLLSCPLSGMTRRHNAIQHDIHSLARSAGVLSSTLNKDVLILNAVVDSTQQRGDLMLPQCGPDDKNMVLDFTITYPTAKSKFEATRRDPDSSIRKANTRKINKIQRTS